MSPKRANVILVAALVLTMDAADAQLYPIHENSELYELLVKHQDDRIPDNTTFASEPLECLFYQNASVDHVISDKDGDSILVFSSVRTDLAGYFLYPNILRKVSTGDWIRTPVPRMGDGWTHIHRSLDGTKTLILMDNVPESAGWETRFVLSEDGGESWAYVSKVKKYIYFDVISYFRLSETGEGIVVEYYDGDVGGYEDAGYYVFRTWDWGHNWSGREHWTDYDTSDLLDISDNRHMRHANRRPLAELHLAGLETCATAN